MFMLKILVIFTPCLAAAVWYFNRIPDSHLDKCPFCYGQRLCVNSTINVTFEKCYLNFFNLKNIYYGTLNKNLVVIKKLATNSELDDFDFTYNNLKFSGFYNEKNKTDLPFINVLGMFYPSKISKFVFCRFNKYTETVLREYLISWKQYDFLNFTDLQFFTALRFMLQINSEPVVLQIFNANDGWPVPIYFGSCGRLAVFQNCGQSLRNFVSSPSLIKLYIIKQLILIAFNFTFNHPHFSLYFTDLTMDNVAVDSNNMIRIIDLENVILVNKNFPNIGNENFRHIITNRSVHQTRHFSCEECLIFSVEDMCNYDISDHNFYSVCKEFLLLPSTLLPAELYEDNDFQQLIKDCVHPTNDEPLARFVAAEGLLNKLEPILISHNFSVENFR